MDDTSREVLSLPEESASTPEAAPPPRHRIDQLASATDCEKFAAEIARDVQRATRGGVRDLRVEVHVDGVEVRGRCSTYYCKQLAQHAAMRSALGAPVTNRIEVW